MTMRSDQWLSVSLLLALCSNASLLLILTFNAFHNEDCCSSSRSWDGQLHPDHHYPPHAASTEQTPLEAQTKLVDDLRAHENRLAKFRSVPRRDKNKNAYSNTNAPSDIVRLHHFLRYESDDLNSLHDDQVWQAEIKEKTFAQDSVKTGEDELSTNIELFLQLYRQLSKIVSKRNLSNDKAEKRQLFKDLSKPGNSATMLKTTVVGEPPVQRGKQFDPKELSTEAFGKSQKSRSQRQSVLGKSREKRDTALMELEAGADGDYLNYEFQFSKLAQNGSLQSSNQMFEVLIPGLITFEDRMIRHVEELHFTMLSHDLRLERVERAVINLAKGKNSNQGKRSRRGDQLLEPIDTDELSMLAEGSDDFTLFSNNSQWQQSNASLEELEDESSGESDINSTLPKSTTTTTSTTSTTTTTTTSEPVAFYDLQRDMQEIQHKVLALENYNTMSDSELTRVRSEVMRMDDKVIEMQRIQKNANSVTGQHTYKINELDILLSRNSMALSTAMEAYSRLNSRVGEFRERLGDFEREMHGVSTHFSKHEQISNELRSADSYKAHDIMEIRKAMVNIETRINELYNVMDQRIESVHTNIRDWFDRLCFNNNLAC